MSSWEVELSRRSLVHVGNRYGVWSVALLYRAFFDDSSDGLQQKYVIAAGLVGRHAVWTKFQKDWKRVLHEQPRIEWFHTREWKSLSGEFAQFRDPRTWPKPKGREAADTKRNDLRSVVEKSHLMGLGLAVYIPDFKLVRSLDNKHRNTCGPILTKGRCNFWCENLQRLFSRFRESADWGTSAIKSPSFPIAAKKQRHMKGFMAISSRKIRK